VVPVNTIVVSDGDLVDDGGATVTIDTSGAGGLPGTPAQSIQFNSDPAGTFTGSERLLFETGSNNAQIFIKSGASATQTEIRAVDGWGMQIGATDADNSIRNQIVLYGENDAPDGILLIPNTGENVVLQTGGLTTSASDGDLVLSTYDDEDKAKITLTAGTDGDILVQTDNAGVLQLENTTTDADSVLSIMGNGTGDAKLDLQNASKRVWVLCDSNKKLKVQGGSGGNTFVFDVSSATGGITFPDASELISAEGTAVLATGVTDGYVLTADGAGASAWEAAGGGGAATLGELTDVLLDETEFPDSLLIQPNSDGSAPTTGTLDFAENNLGIGADVFSTITSAFQNTVYGNFAGDAITSATANTLVGYSAGSALETATGNVLIGRNAGYSITGSGNTIVGKNALYFQTSTTYNVAMGDRAGYFGAGDKNIFIGYKAAYHNPAGTGDNNIVIGAQSVGTSPSAGEGNVALGQGEHTVATGDDQLLISSGQGSVNWIRGDDAGACYQGDNATTWSTTSDQRLKREIVDATVGLDAINAVRVRNFRYIEKAEPIIETDEDGDEHIVGYDGENRYDLDPEPLRVGVIAQEVGEVFPTAVKENGLGHLIVNPDSINWALLKAVQELSAKVEALEDSQ